MAFASFVTVFFYLSVPFVASAVMRGLSGTTATLRAGVQGAMQTAGMMVGAGLTAAGAATFGSSAAAQTGIEGAKTAAAGRIANDFAGARGLASNIHGSDAADLPPPPPLSPAPIGESYENPFNPTQVADQTAADSFTVTDSVQGTVSHHRGNIYMPHAAEVAFNSHCSKVQQGPPPLPTNNPV
jgi:hypothetical protein